MTSMTSMFVEVSRFAAVAFAAAEDRDHVAAGLGACEAMRLACVDRPSAILAAHVQRVTWGVACDAFVAAYAVAIDRGDPEEWRAVSLAILGLPGARGREELLGAINALAGRLRDERRNAE